MRDDASSLRARAGPLVSAAAAGLTAWVAGCALMIAWGYGLSAFHLLSSRGGCLIGTAISIIVAMMAGRAMRVAWLIGSPTPAAADRPMALFILYAGVGAVVIAGAITGLVAAPSNWDSLTYHLARVGYYLQQGSLADFGANYYCQEEHGRAASILLCALLSLCGRSDALFALPQLFAYGACLAAVYLMVRQIGHGT